ncbi:uncharacterized protein LOC142608762 [Castanea sativa]|uniref:uncharacterized protein LOC142608762 n=1 Tax=Castanea sativa TaxID=21020 RepID=UPI003F6501E9
MKGTYGRKRTKIGFSLDSSRKATWHPPPQLPPKILDWVNTLSSGPTGTQNMPHKDCNFSGGGYSKKDSAIWAVKPSGYVGGSNSGLSSNKMGNVKSNIANLAQHSGTSPSPSGQALKKMPSSVKGKKALARGSPSKGITSSADNPLSKLLTASITSFSSDRASSPIREVAGPSNSFFEFMASPLARLEIHDDKGSAPIAVFNEDTVGKLMCSSTKSVALTKSEDGDDRIGAPSFLYIMLVEELARTEQEIHVEVKVAELHNKPWVMAGDFNEPLIDEDKFGGKGVSVNSSLAFKDCLDDCNMVNMGFTSPKYTWTNKRDIGNLILERTDRFFMNPDWRKRNHIASIKDEREVWIINGREVREHFRKGFVSLYTTSLVEAARVPSHVGQWQGCLSEEARSSLDAMVIEVRKVFIERKVPNYLNKTLLVLIPKIQGPESFGNYKPISLCNSIYKIISKVIVSRLRPHLENIVSPLQAAFIPGRRETDNVIIVQELIHSIGRAKGGKGYMATKIDLEKAYDRIEWYFIREMLFKFNFPEKRIDLIMSCVSSVYTSLLCNGGCLDSFCLSRGIRQEDPLSPYLFILCMEFLGHSTEEKCAAKVWNLVKASRNGPSFSHLFFVDDLVLFAEVDNVNCLAIKEALQEFCTRLGQKVSEAKSHLFFSPNVDPDQRDLLSNFLGFSPTSNLGKYLGFPLKHTGVRKHYFDFVLDRVKKNLSGWKANLLSMAGQLVLIHASSSTIPNFVMQQASLPEKILKGIDRVNRNFLWGSLDHVRKMHWVKWDVVTKPKELGGLRLQSAKGRNTTLLAKLNWRFHTEMDAPWANVLKYKYCTRQRINSRNEARLPSSPIWKAIKKGGPLPQDSFNLKLKDVTSLGRWDWSKIPFNIPSEIRDEIQAIPIPLLARNNDKLAWKFSPKGCFDMRSAYLIANNLVEDVTFAGS